MKDEYPDVKSDLFAGFIQRCTELAGPRAAVAMITMQSWMFLSSYEKLRASLLANQRITSMLHLGARAFDSIGGEVVSSTAFVLTTVPAESRATSLERPGSFIRLVDETSEAEKIVALGTALEVRCKDTGFHLASAADFEAIPGSPIVYWLSEKVRRIFSTYDSIGHNIDAIAGISTGDNLKYFRYWHEVSADRTGGRSEKAPWAPHHKGGAARNWSGNIEHVLRYTEASVKQMEALPGFRHDGNSEYFKPHIGWSALTSGLPSFRAIPAGCTFGSGSKALVLSDDAAMELIAILNSTLSAKLLGALSPTMNYEVGHILALPIVPPDSSANLAARARRMVNESNLDWNSLETSSGFSCNPLVELAHGPHCEET